MHLAVSWHAHDPHYFAARLSAPPVAACRRLRHCALEDETGCVSVIVWRDLSERQRRELLGARLMAVYGSVEREGEVVHVIARRLADHSYLLGRLATRSRDFH